MLHVDVMDGHFVPNLTIGPLVVKWIRRHCDLYLDCHLMMDNPGQYLEAFRDAGADSCTVHVEVGGTGELIAQMRELGLEDRAGGQPGDGFRGLRAVAGPGGHGAGDDGAPGLRRAELHERGGAQDRPCPGAHRPGRLGRRAGGGRGDRPPHRPVVSLAGARLLVAGSAIFGQQDAVAAARGGA